MIAYREQFKNLSQSLSYSLQRQADKLERFTAQLYFAHRLRVLYPEQERDWQERIIAAGCLVQEGLQNKCVDLDDLVARGEAALQPIGQVAREYTLLCIGHAHIDMNWQWSWPETVALTHDTFQTMLILMHEFPDFIFSQSQASTYHLIEKYNPVMFEAIRQRVQEGRWEVTASQWVEGDKNLASGESISRHLLYTRQYFQEKFGLAPEDVQVTFEPDTFGHAATLPGILARGGVRYYYHCRGSYGPHLYWWVGPDGSRLLTVNDVMWYMRSFDPRDAASLVDFSAITGLKYMPLLYGVGDHGGGPTRRDLRRLIEMKNWPIFPHLELCSLGHFFRLAEAEAHHIPEVVGERNFVFTGCYTSQARHKQANRQGENLLFAAEVAATLGDQIAGVAYPRQNLDEAWRYLLFDQFHDILPGSGTRDTRDYTLGHAQETQAAAAMARTNALRALSQRIDTAALLCASSQDGGATYKDEVESARSLGAGAGYGSGSGDESAVSLTQTSERAFLVFNPLPHARTDVVEVKLWDTELDRNQLAVAVEGNQPQRVQVLDTGRYWGHRYMTVAVPVEAPALGYRALCISDRLNEVEVLTDTARNPWIGMTLADMGLAACYDTDPGLETMGALRKLLPPDLTLENEFLQVRLDPASGGIASLVDKRTGREWVPAGRLSGTLQHCLEANQGMSAWVIGPFLEQQDLLSGGTLKKVHHGPYLQTFRWTRMLNDTSLELDIMLRQGLPRVEFRLRVDWREIGHPDRGIPHLRVRFPLAVREPQPGYEIPFGSIRRDLFNGEEVPALRWADLSEADGQGVTLVNSSRYGFNLEGNTLTMTLLRASVDPDPLPDLGEHIIEYALVPHGEGWGVGDCTRVGEDLNVPLVVTSCGFQAGDLPSVMSFITLAPENVRLAAIKKSQDGAAIILRLVEVEGAETEARLTLSSALISEGASVAEVDTLERPLAVTSARLQEGTLVARLPAYGITTLRISRG